MSIPDEMLDQTTDDDYDYDSPCDDCPEKWMDKDQWDCPWHLNNKRCDCY